jgi:hypothetical protein
VSNRLHLLQSRKRKPIVLMPQRSVSIREARPRGQLLYENHCMVCHESIVHIRSKQSARSLEDLHARVLHWARYMKLPWSEEEVGDVTRFLESRYYQFESRP